MLFSPRPSLFAFTKSKGRLAADATPAVPSDDTVIALAADAASVSSTSTTGAEASTTRATNGITRWGIILNI